MLGLGRVVMVFDGVLQDDRKPPFSKEDPSDIRMVVTEEIEFRRTEKAVGPLCLQEDFFFLVGKMFIKDESPDIMEKTCDKETLRIGNVLMAGKDAGRYPTGEAVFPEGLHIDQVRRNILKDTDDGSPECQGTQLFASHNHDRP